MLRENISPRWHIYPDNAEISTRLAAAITRMAAEAVARRGAFHLVVAGGNTPRAAYVHLPALGSDWQHWHIYHGDERCLAVDAAERNSVMLEATWLSQVPIPRTQIHHIPAERGAQEAARIYAEVLPRQPFDLVLLGLGEDGHTASLFPGHDWGQDTHTPATLAIFDAAKAPAERVSLSAWRLRQTRALFFLVCGAGKQNALRAWLQNAPIPATTVGSDADVWLDMAAWPETLPETR
ncbi:6-phosphogluconolactonase [Acidithiobacillus montserratensis]|uniref:6-phosphogluconolactonase n=1 Tax=Acidithiobacillus montserratensis TaxID=2729135 RepID=A0ACD5HG31_9PROT|nr:6-phosphogluconolactonase [Acidithiobacillus montserratensis]MBN2680483.1 6-phosphogluconolactonase [Acidithiobacillaceae bacterium]MBU2748757.1 6-phosphogluconolactonase [Acidithiobacillus montserratensis]